VSRLTEGGFEVVLLVLLEGPRPISAGGARYSHSDGLLFSTQDESILFRLR